MPSTFPLCIFFIFGIAFFLRDHNGNEAVQLFCAIPVAIGFLIVFRNSITILLPICFSKVEKITNKYTLKKISLF